MGLIFIQCQYPCVPNTLPGSFGDVYAGTLLDQDMTSHQKVAVKTLNGKLLLFRNSIQNEKFREKLPLYTRKQ